jgi:anti-sigma factor RsiW
MTMTCRRAVELLIDYVADDLPPDQRLVLESHFQKCPPCLIYLQSYQVTIKLTRQLPHEAPIPAELECRLLDVLKAAQQEGLRPEA